MDNMGTVVDLRNATSRARYGGKASSLARLLQAGIPVPHGLVLPCDVVSQLTETPSGRVADDLTQALILLSPNSERVAVRSSATVEDGSINSYAGILTTRLGIPCRLDEVWDALIECARAASSARVHTYQAMTGHTGEPVNLALIIQHMVDAQVSGVLFTKVDRVSGGSAILVEAVAGLGESLVAGQVRPQRYLVASDSLQRLDNEPHEVLLSERQLRQLEDVALDVQALFQFPQDVEWCLTQEGDIRILQSRDITAPVKIEERRHSSHSGSLIGFGASPGQASGKPHITIEDEIEAFPLSGAVLVAEYTDTNFLLAMRRAAAIVTEEGGLLSHAAIVSRELGLPCVVGASDATARLAGLDRITVDGTRGEVILGEVKTNRHRTRIELFDYSQLFCFDSVLELSMQGHQFIIEPTWGHVVVHLSENSSDELKKSIISHFPEGVLTEFRRGPKYSIYKLWQQRMKYLPVFAREFLVLTEIVETLDARSIDLHFKGMAEQTTKSMRFARDSSQDSIERYASLVIANGRYMLANVLLPEGYGARAVYRTCFPYVTQERMTFGELLRDSTAKHPAIITRALETYKVLAHWREKSYPIYQDAGATGAEYVAIEEELQRDLGFLRADGADVLLERVAQLSKAFWLRNATPELGMDRKSDNEAMP